ncbi:hypothetical protein HZ326_27555, partial [Fusarium oxysporum f. sp. albedinis]
MDHHGSSSQPNFVYSLSLNKPSNYYKFHDSRYVSTLLPCSTLLPFEQEASPY